MNSTPIFKSLDSLRIPGSHRTKSFRISLIQNGRVAMRTVIHDLIGCQDEGVDETQFAAFTESSEI
jgi:hypothetical protein